MTQSHWARPLVNSRLRTPGSDMRSSKFPSSLLMLKNFETFWPASKLSRLLGAGAVKCVAIPPAQIDNAIVIANQAMMTHSTRVRTAAVDHPEAVFLPGERNRFKIGGDV